MADGKIPDAAILRQILGYDPETGRLFHRERPSQMFISESAARHWNRRFAGKEAFASLSSHGYRRGKVLNIGCFAHRVIWKIVHGVDPQFIDHINGNRLDNKLSNLRSVSVADNTRNRKMPETNMSGVCGVCWNRGRREWQASIVRNGARFQKRFSSLVEAAAWRREMEVSLGFHPNHGR